MFYKKFTSSYYWDDYESFFQNNAKSHKLNQARSDIKKHFTKLSKIHYTPVYVITNSFKTNCSRSLSRLIVSIKDSDIAKMKKNKYQIPEKIIQGSKYINRTSHPLLSGLLNYYAFDFDNKYSPNFETVSGYSFHDAQNSITNYFNGLSSIEDLQSIIDFPKIKEDDTSHSGLDINDENYCQFNRTTFTYLIGENLNEYYRLKKLIQSKIKIQSLSSLDASYYSGKRINRSYLNKTSIKPLLEKSVTTPSKKKVLFILDASGSMSGEPIHKAISFVSALINSGVIESSQVIWHSCSGFKNILGDIRKEKLTTTTYGAEGFEDLSGNLPDEWIKDADYVVALTDLIYNSSAEEGLAKYIKKGKKHLVLSFDRSGNVQGMNVRVCKETNKMVDAIMTMVQS